MEMYEILSKIRQKSTSLVRVDYWESQLIQIFPKIGRYILYSPRKCLEAIPLRSQKGAFPKTKQHLKMYISSTKPLRNTPDSFTTEEGFFLTKKVFYSFLSEKEAIRRLAHSLKISAHHFERRFVSIPMGILLRTIQTGNQKIPKKKYVLSDTAIRNDSPSIQKLEKYG